MKLAVLMNPLSTLTPATDTSLAFLRRAKALQWSCCYFTPDDLFCREGVAYSQVYSIEGLGDSPEVLHSADQGVQPLSTFDIILMRLDPPFNMEYIYTTYALDLAEQAGVLVANKPQSLRDVSEKYFTLHVPQCCPPTLVSRSHHHLQAFWREHQQVILKPLDGMGGHSVFYVGEDGINLPVILETLTNHQHVSIMAQKYIPGVATLGDKRILLIHGEPVPYALARIPREGEVRANIAVGGHGVVVPITARDRWICQELSPILREKKLSFVGIDVIGDYLTEINVTSPTCLLEIEAETGLDIAGDYLNFLASQIKK
jgi:glutathione synthase